MVIASILIVQCLIFQDGGLLALGTNIINMGIVPCYLGYAVFNIVAGARPRPTRLYTSVFVATGVGMIVGAALVPLEVAVSGVASVPLPKFLLVMVGLHLPIALGEAIITFVVIGYLSKVRPESLGPMAEKLAPAGGGLSRKTVLASILVVALLLGGVVSLFASGLPDALESITSIEDAPHEALVQADENETVARISTFQERIALLPDYRWTSFSGVIGTVAILLVVWLIGRALRRPGDKTAVH